MWPLKPPAHAGIVTGRGTNGRCEIVRRGCALATFYGGDIDSDRAEGHGRDAAGGQGSGPEHPTNRGTIAVAWGFHRCVDYLETARIDASDRGVGPPAPGQGGVARTAFDDRIALVISVRIRPAVAAAPPAGELVGESAKSGSTRRSLTGSTPPSKTSTMRPNDCRSISIALSPSVRRDRCCSPTRRTINGPIHPVSSTCFEPRILSIDSSASRD